MRKACMGLVVPGIGHLRSGSCLQRLYQTDSSSVIRSLTHSGPGPQGQDSGSRTVIQEFYRDTNVFITGATGFLGKMLIEKLLRSCPDVSGIYVLVRSKKDMKAEERLDEITKSMCFSRLLQECPASLGKIHAVVGDIGMEGLGISDEDCHLLVEKVNVVFHVAATVTFNMALGSAIKMNVRGTRDMLLLSKTFHNLKSFVHVSTAFAHCPSPKIKESFYPTPLECDEAIAMAERVKESDLDVATPDIVGEWPNTYSFTKAIAENTVRQYGQEQGLPVGIVRPSLVIWTHKEPLPGWLDNMYGPSGVAAAIFAGVGHTMQLDSNKIGNMVPGDVVVNGLIVSAWDVATNWFPVTQTPIYHSVSSAKSIMTYGTFCGEVVKYSRITPSAKAVDYPYWLPSTHKWIVGFNQVLLHLLPAALMDAATAVVGGKPRLLRTYKKIHHFNQVITWFGLREWHFEEKNLINLWNILDSRDKALFPFDMRSMNWETFFQDTFLGFRTYMMKEDPETIPAARTRMRWLVWCKIAGLAVVTGMIGGICITI